MVGVFVCVRKKSEGVYSVKFVIKHGGKKRRMPFAGVEYSNIVITTAGRLALYRWPYNEFRAPG